MGLHVNLSAYLEGVCTCVQAGVSSLISKAELPTADAGAVEDSHVPPKLAHLIHSTPGDTAHCICIFTNDKIMAQRVQIAIDSSPWDSEFKHLTLPPPHVSGVNGALVGFLYDQEIRSP